MVLRSTIDAPNGVLSHEYTSLFYHEISTYYCINIESSNNHRKSIQHYFDCIEWFNDCNLEFGFYTLQHYLNVFNKI